MYMFKLKRNVLIWSFKLKVVAIDGQLAVVHQSSVQFDIELPEFRYYSHSLHGLKMLKCCLLIL